jgi:hypothetical protein
MHPVLGREVVEGQQLLGVVDDLRDRLGILRGEQLGELLDGDLGVLAVLGVADLRQRPAGGRLRRLRQAVDHIRYLVHLMPSSA